MRFDIAAASSRRHVRRPKDGAPATPAQGGKPSKVAALVGEYEVDMNIYEIQPKNRDSHEHCFHVYRGAIWMVIPDGHVVEKCCKCETTSMTHADHMADRWRSTTKRVTL